jgi:quercetin dioxygenase-like cupin family protein
VTTSPTYLVLRAGEVEYGDPGPVAPDSTGLSRWSGVTRARGSLHTGVALCRLEAGGQVPAHVHSFEESCYVLEGEVVLQTPDGATQLRPGDYGLVPLGVPHGWRSAGNGPARWVEVAAPAPRERYGLDTVRVPDLAPTEPVPVDPRDPRTRSFGSITAEHMDPGRQSQELLAMSASMRTALLVYSGITLKMMVDSDLGAVLSSMFMVQYDPDGRAGPHDHPLEEAYLILDGEVDATFDGEEYRLRPGDLAWTGVGCVHSFAAVGDRVRWLETQAPQLPPRHGYRFVRDWDYLTAQLGAPPTKEDV